MSSKEELGVISQKHLSPLSQTLEETLVVVYFNLLIHPMLQK